MGILSKAAGKDLVETLRSENAALLRENAELKRENAALSAKREKDDVEADERSFRRERSERTYALLEQMHGSHPLIDELRKLEESEE